jgi:ribosomal protein S3
MKLFNFKKRNKSDKEFQVYKILKDWFAEFTTYGKTFVTFELTKKEVLNIYSNHPGVMIGKAGERIDRYKKRLKEEVGIKKVNLYEHRNVVSNFGIGTWERGSW